MDVIIGLDAGTSAIKAVAFDEAGIERASASQRNRYDIGTDGSATQPMRRTWGDCASVLRELAGQLRADGLRPVALGVTAQGDGMWLVDDAGAPVGDGWLWLDARAAAIADELSRRPEERLRFMRTGTGLTACQQGPQLVWMRRNAPDLLDRARTAFHCKDYLYLCLTGIRATDPCEAAMSFGDFRTRAYSDEVLGALGIADLARLLPPILDGSLEAHPMTGEAASATGLPAGLPVALGYLDAACTALGAGVHEGGRDHGCTILGSTGVHLRAMAASDVVLGANGTGYVLPLPLSGRVAMMQTNMSGTINIDWILRLGRGLVRDVAGTDHDLIAHLDAWLTGAPSYGVIYHPFISTAGERGPFVAPDARAAFLGLSSSVGWGDLVRAVVEGLAYAARDCHQAMGGIAGEIRLTGGAARSGTVRAIHAAVLGEPVRRVRRDEAGALGAAMIAATSAGVFGDMAAAIAAWVTPMLDPAETPDPADAVRYDQAFALYRETRQAMRAQWPGLAGLCSAG
jgi:erythritol kinase